MYFLRSEKVHILTETMFSLHNSDVLSLNMLACNKFTYNYTENICKLKDIFRKILFISGMFTKSHINIQKMRAISSIPQLEGKSAKINTVKPVYNDHPRDPKIVAVVDRWSLLGGHLCYKRSNWDLKTVAVVDRWSLFGGGR
jgi:hypothetical protein